MQDEECQAENNRDHRKWGKATDYPDNTQRNNAFLDQCKFTALYTFDTAFCEKGDNPSTNQANDDHHQKECELNSLISRPLCYL